jgi:hypothetical protein
VAMNVEGSHGGTTHHADEGSHGVGGSGETTWPENGIFFLLVLFQFLVFVSLTKS